MLARRGRGRRWACKETRSCTTARIPHEPTCAPPIFHGSPGQTCGASGALPGYGVPVDNARIESLATFLARTPFFGGLQGETLHRLVGTLTERNCETGEVIFREGDSGRSMYIIHTGQAVVCRTGDSGRLIKLFRMGPGALFGETTLVEMQPRPHTVVVEQPARLYELTNARLYKLYKEDVQTYVMVLQNINRELCRRLRRSDGRLTEWADELDDPVTQIRTRESWTGVDDDGSKGS